MEDSDTDFIVEGNQDKHEDQDEEDNSLDNYNLIGKVPTYNQPDAIANESTSAEDTNVKKNAHPKKKKTPKKKFIGKSLRNYIKIQNEFKLNDEVLIKIYLLDNFPNLFENFDDFNENQF